MEAEAVVVISLAVPVFAPVASTVDIIGLSTLLGSKTPDVAEVVWVVTSDEDDAPADVSV